MERKTTEIEKRLLGNGYRLTKKIYGGIKSQKTLYYYYEKGNQYVKLDYKREQVLGVGISNYSKTELTRMEIEGAMIIIRNIEDDIKYDNEEMVKTEPLTGTFEEIDTGVNALYAIDESKALEIFKKAQAFDIIKEKNVAITMIKQTQSVRDYDFLQIKRTDEEMVKTEPTTGTFEEIDTECQEREK